MAWQQFGRILQRINFGTGEITSTMSKDDFDKFISKPNKRIAELKAELEYLKAEKRHFMANLERQSVYVSKDSLYKFWDIAERQAKKFTNYKAKNVSDSDTAAQGSE